MLRDTVTTRTINNSTEQNVAVMKPRGEPNKQQWCCSPANTMKTEARLRINMWDTSNHACKHQQQKQYSHYISKIIHGTSSPWSVARQSSSSRAGRRSEGRGLRQAKTMQVKICHNEQFKQRRSQGLARGIKRLNKWQVCNDAEICGGERISARCTL